MATETPLQPINLLLQTPGYFADAVPSLLPISLLASAGWGRQQKGGGEERESASEQLLNLLFQEEGEAVRKESTSQFLARGAASLLLYPWEQEYPPLISLVTESLSPPPLTSHSL